jgi:hypothetical protein
MMTGPSIQKLNRMMRHPLPFGERESCSDECNANCLYFLSETYSWHTERKWMPQNRVEQYLLFDNDQPTKYH